MLALAARRAPRAARLVRVIVMLADEQDHVRRSMCARVCMRAVRVWLSRQKSVRVRQAGRLCVYVCVRARVRACVCECVHARVCMRLCACEPTREGSRMRDDGTQKLLVHL